MSKLEKINLFFGFVALLADLSSLLAFTTGLISFEQVIPQNMNLGSALFLYKVITFLFLTYGWFIFSWYLTRRTFVLKQSRKKALSSRSANAVAGVGLFLVPIAIAWTIFVAQPNTSMPSNSEANIIPTVAPTITPSPLPPTQSIETPDSFSITATPSSATTKREYSQADDVMMAITMGLMLGMPFLGFVIWGSINLLMPLINIELLDD